MTNQAIEDFRPKEEEYQQNVADNVRFQEKEPDPDPAFLILSGLVMLMRKGQKNDEIRALLDELVVDARTIKSLMVGSYV